MTLNKALLAIVVLLLGIAATALLAHADTPVCQAYRGQAWLYPVPLDGTYTINDNAVLYSYTPNDDGTQTFEFGTLITNDTQTLTLAPDNVIWFSKEDNFPYCQFSLGYQAVPAPRKMDPEPSRHK
jgi:hypothetical protein